MGEAENGAVALREISVTRPKLVFAEPQPLLRCLMNGTSSETASASAANWVIGHIAETTICQYYSQSGL